MAAWVGALLALKSLRLITGPGGGKLASLDTHEVGFLGSYCCCVPA